MSVHVQHLVDMILHYKTSTFVINVKMILKQPTLV